MAILTENDANLVLDNLINILCSENSNQDIKSFSLEKKSFDEKKIIYQKLLMSRELKPVPFEFFKYQNEFLEFLNNQTKSIQVSNFEFYHNMTIYNGNIANLKTDAIVCSCLSNLACGTSPDDIDVLSSIVFSGGIQIRQDLNFIVQKQQCLEPIGSAIIVKGYNLPAKYVICTVGPSIVSGRLGYREKEGLINCYKSCLNLALEKGLKSIAFCAISTGNKNFPKPLASEIAVSTVFSWLKTHNFPLQVVFCVFDDENKSLYETAFRDYDII